MTRSKIKKHRTIKAEDTIRSIVVHNTCTRCDVTYKEGDDIPFNYVINPDGRLIAGKIVKPGDLSIHIAWAGGLNKHGRHRDNRTMMQNESLFHALLLLSDWFENAKVIGADELRPYAYGNPGFDVRSWLHSYIPEYLKSGGFSIL